MWSVVNDDICNWAKSYNGPLFHAIICDPPYNLDTITKRFGKKNSAPARYGIDGVFQRSSKGFMNKEWDTDIAFQPETWELIGNLLYPGAFCMAFGGSRTYHRMATAIESAGFIIHPMIGWIQGQGFPKATKIKNNKTWEEHRYGLQTLKPSLEPICMFQIPYDGRPLDNITQTGAGAIWIEGARIGNEEIPSNQFDNGMKPFGDGAGHPYTQKKNEGRWPANVVLSGEIGPPYDKFFYQAKANKKERNLGLDELPKKFLATMGDGIGKKEHNENELGAWVQNNHPTVKPIDLIKHLGTILLPPSEYNPRRLLVPFAGSGSEMIGVLLAGWDEVTGVEIEKESCEIANKRLEYWINAKEE